MALEMTGSTEKPIPVVLLNVLLSNCLVSSHDLIHRCVLLSTLRWRSPILQWEVLNAEMLNCSSWGSGSDMLKITDIHLKNKEKVFLKQQVL